MIELEALPVKVEELIEPDVKKGKIKVKRDERPFVLNAKVYKLKSAFVDYSIYITITYKEEENGRKVPFEVFINSKDLSKAAEYTMLTRLISAIFRRSEDPTFIIEELRSIYDPNGGHFKDGKYFPSMYAEIADILEQFFEEIGLIKKGKKGKQTVLFDFNNKKQKEESNINLKICPKCSQKTLKIEAGCVTCINPECGYSKCD